MSMGPERPLEIHPKTLERVSGLGLKTKKGIGKLHQFLKCHNLIGF